MRPEGRARVRLVVHVWWVHVFLSYPLALDPLFSSPVVVGLFARLWIPVFGRPYRSRIWSYSPFPWPWFFFFFFFHFLFFFPSSWHLRLAPSFSSALFMTWEIFEAGRWEPLMDAGWHGTFASCRTAGVKHTIYGSIQCRHTQGVWGVQAGGHRLPVAVPGPALDELRCNARRSVASLDFFFFGMWYHLYAGALFF